MTKTKDVPKRRKVFNLILLAVELFGAANHLVSLVKIESYLAKRNIILLGVLSLFLGILLISTWLCALAVMFSYLVAFHFSVSAALCLLLLLNILLMLFVFFIMMRIKRQITFIETRERLLSFLSFLSND